MSIRVSAIDAVGTIGKEWAQSVKRRPLEKGVARYVTVATDGLTETLGRSAEGVITLHRKAANGAEEVTIGYLGEPKLFKAFKFADGSSCETRFFNGIPKRTNGQFVLTEKNGEKTFSGSGR